MRSTLWTRSREWNLVFGLAPPILNPMSPSSCLGLRMIYKLEEFIPSTPTSTPQVRRTGRLAGIFPRLSLPSDVFSGVNFSTSKPKIWKVTAFYFFYPLSHKLNSVIMDCISLYFINQDRTYLSYLRYDKYFKLICFT